MQRAALTCRCEDFVLAPDAEQADFVLFVDSSDHYLRDVSKSRMFREHEPRSFVFNHNDNAFPAIPGIYPDIAAPVRLPELQLGGFYLRCFDNSMLIANGDDDRQPRYLFSFVGDSRNSPGVRNRILALRHPRALLVDRSSGLRDDDAEYVETLRNSLFVLCPRGLGPSSWRYYETMMASRVPVIVSDEWLPAREIDWPSFSIRVPETEVESIPELCERNAPLARAMGRVARQQWEANCGVDTAFGWVGRRLCEMQSNDRAGLLTRGELLRELRFRRMTATFVRSRIGRWLRAIASRPRRQQVL
jgi:hypothetical protein